MTRDFFLTKKECFVCLIHGSTLQKKKYVEDKVLFEFDSLCCWFICCEQQFASHSQTSGCRIHHGTHAETWFLFVPGASLAIRHSAFMASVLQLQLCSQGTRQRFTANGLSIPLLLSQPCSTLLLLQKWRGRRKSRKLEDVRSWIRPGFNFHDWGHSSAV